MEVSMARENGPSCTWTVGRRPDRREFFELALALSAALLRGPDLRGRSGGRAPGGCSANVAMRGMRIVQNNSV
jgi:hypothetical protein